MALGLLEEQVQARIVHYKAELETNPELDAITAQVVAQLREMQGQASAESKVDRNAIRSAHEKTLRDLLSKFFRSEGLTLLVEKRLKEIHRKLARQFFQSELHDKTRGKDGGTKVIQHGEQALFYLLVRYDHRMKNELQGFDYASDEVKERSFELLAKLTKDMQDAFLSRRSTELKRIVAAFHSVLVDFLCKQIAPAVTDLAQEVIAQSGSWEGRAYTYKITSDAFPRFRAAFERRFMTRLVGFAEDQLHARLVDTAGNVQEETVQFITNPAVFSMICGEITDGVYEYLCNEGFLDMPGDYRAAQQTA
ncbi:MAG: hypothetical protein IPK82_32090 [Polyangiaceae bacterium]|nr:hypothetical protein [Polyangiaceae bacterium]